MFKLGFIINPIAGIGGSVALKGSDGDGIAEQALALGATAKANQRASLALSILLPYRDDIIVYCANDLMGEMAAQALGFKTQVVFQTDKPEHTTAEDTENTVKALLAEHVDILLFAGGDGTARNVCKIVGDKFPVLGIPAGCKIHSGVYAVTPKAAGRVVEMMLTNQLVTLTEADVMDIDESLFREGIVKAKRYGEMQIPAELRYVQAVKSGGKELDELVLQDIAAHVINEMDDELFVIGSGSTTAFLMEELALDNTLLGVDLVEQQHLIASDVTEPQLWQAITLAKADNKTIKLVITLIGGQGHIFGRGNQQLSPRVVRAIGKDNILIIATKAKLTALASRPLIADTGDSDLDIELSGYLPVITGYNDQVLYPVASPQ
ncbi:MULTISPECIES: ATP-NAD kinase family protein [unclassified Colwellia]|jgi:predicted polyphosphate/ATP-dependent NAD kinase|uniref:ATP-NAD kinase family protein n=1 Tax=unclassified Colwellia TaxID=196834 RepID=UPI0015F3F228|nr:MULTISPECIES: ATP-NAD kinase family protein [unclassified Colwellia]MBA6363314.1 ATP-NAD kinase family protein [Colwellia sp. BRX8-8]MBA6337640.1 ATP-NAD kinase family protein [Colwellia sp. BRX8-7]MBA6354856.1 ATP-NAD kinase family protein [Colwellia sp. BRX8-3]MBA6360208.1 ATP-NAD kinase family protein [Colwellia sp. BRX8-6]MBA6367621.1 ATP-NAD kinase family protein [Colwellia sp. BRX8-5]